MPAIAAAAAAAAHAAYSGFDAMGRMRSTYYVSKKLSSKENLVTYRQKG